jgi:hypothetical protein
MIAFIPAGKTHIPIDIAPVTAAQAIANDRNLEPDIAPSQP